MKIPFKHYLHDNYSSSELAEVIYESIASQYEGTEEELRELLGDSRPFYEVQLNCELDTKTGKVKILSVGSLQN